MEFRIANNDVSWAVEFSALAENLLSAHDPEPPAFMPQGGWFDPAFDSTGQFRGGVTNG